MLELRKYGETSDKLEIFPSVAVRLGVCTDIGSKIECLPRSFIFEACQGPEQCSWAAGTMICVDGQCQCRDGLRLTSDRICTVHELSGPVRPLVFSSLAVILFTYVIIVLNILLDIEERRKFASLPSPTVIVNDQFDNRKFKKFNDQLDEALDSSLNSVPSEEIHEHRNKSRSTKSVTLHQNEAIPKTKSKPSGQIAKIRRSTKPSIKQTRGCLFLSDHIYEGIRLQPLPIELSTNNGNNEVHDSVTPLRTRQIAYRTLVKLCTERLVKKMADMYFLQCEAKAGGDDRYEPTASFLVNDPVYGTDILSCDDVHFSFRRMKSIITSLLTEKIHISISGLDMANMTKVAEARLM
ncbi:uncharacterized protein LOC111272738 isoform X2 [Varroa jacobsoni]|uniref:EB domain-containing protein n=1 Tax=Varroa destructor TaxID=109461 RepID=A0A7M7K367_VARDE|nr:uncharacterized protein LOC111250270 isoform X3 [Varroa destructor]XP_022710078.1 uncharacterized protein LOC111272738 isoform X2 [Varroa jacobsoni]